MITGNNTKLTVRARYALPSAVSVLRVLLALLLVSPLCDSPERILIAAFFGVPIVMFLDAVDGILARRFNSQTLLGSFIDIAADRLVEFLFLQYFVRAGLVPSWFIWIFYIRIVLTDACRLRAFGMEQVSTTGIFLPKPWRFLVLSKLSRSGYGAIKGILFSVFLLGMRQGQTSYSFLGFCIMLTVLAFSVLRAVPILFTYLPVRGQLFSPSLEMDIHSEVKAISTTKVVSWVQLISDFCLALILLALTLR